MRIVVNGEDRVVREGATVADVVRSLELGSDPRGVAVAVDREVVARGAWAATVLQDGARVEVLGAIGGGR